MASLIGCFVLFFPVVLLSDGFLFGFTSCKKNKLFYASFQIILTPLAEMIAN